VSQNDVFEWVGAMVDRAKQLPTGKEQEDAVLDALNKGFSMMTTRSVETLRAQFSTLKPQTLAEVHYREQGILLCEGQLALREIMNPDFLK
jgi:hypothetical protein